MFDKFGEFNSAEEINEAAAAQLQEGDKMCIRDSPYSVFEFKTNIRK